MNSQVHWEQQDLFAIKSNSQQPVKDQPIHWIISNPPYGERLLRDFDWRDYFTNLVSNYHPERLALLVPVSSLKVIERAAQQSNYVRKQLEFTKNGGIETALVCFRQK